MDINYTYCGDHFIISTYIKALCCIPETNILLYVNFMSVRKIKFIKDKKIALFNIFY